MEVSVVIPSYRGDEKVLRLVASLQDQLDISNYEILVVANPPNAGLRKILANQWRVRYLEIPQAGANRARNAGLNAASGEIVLFVDDDCLVNDRFFLQKHRQAHLARPHVTALGGDYLLRRRSSFLDQVYHDLQSRWIYEGILPGYEADLLFGGNMSFKRKKIAEFAFDDSLIFGGTETEFLQRLALAGHQVVLLDSLPLLHLTQLRFRDFLSKAFLQGRGAAYVEHKLGLNFGRVIRNHKRNPSLVINGKKAALLRFLFEICFQVGFHSGNRRERKLSWLHYFSILKQAALGIRVKARHVLFRELRTSLGVYFLSSRGQRLK